MWSLKDRELEAVVEDPIPRPERTERPVLRRSPLVHGVPASIAALVNSAPRVAATNTMRSSVAYRVPSNFSLSNSTVRTNVSSTAILEEKIRKQGQIIQEKDQELNQLRAMVKAQGQKLAAYEREDRARREANVTLVPRGFRQEKLFLRGSNDLSNMKYNETFILYIMRLLGRGLSYTAIIEAVYNLKFLLNRFNFFCDLNDVQLCKATLSRYMMVFGTMQKLFLAQKLTNMRHIQSGTDETPDATGVPALVLYARNLENGENLILGLRQMARKRASDFVRLQEQVIVSLIETAKLEGTYVTQFLAKLRIRIADGCPTEGRITRMIQDQIRNETGESVDLCRLTCSLHTLNTSLRTETKFLAI